MVHKLSTCRRHRYIYLIKFSFRFLVGFHSINIHRLFSTVLAGTHRSLNSQSHVQLIFRQRKRFCQKNFFELQGKKSYSLRLNIELLLQRAFISESSFFFSVTREFVLALQESKSVSKNTTRKDKQQKKSL